MSMKITLAILFVSLASAVTGDNPWGEGDVVIRTALRPTAQCSVVTGLSNPFVRKVEDHEKKGLVGNDVFEGYSIDVLKEIQKLCVKYDYPFEYTLKLGDGKYGVIVDGEWRGMVADVMNGKADMAITDITITDERKAVVNFSVPFMKFGIGALAKKSEKPSIFSFLAPLPRRIWYYLGFSILTVSMVFAAFSRLLSHSERQLSCCSTICRSMWFVVTSLVKNSNGNMPQRISIRILVLTWWLAALIFVATYTASLTAHLTVGELSKPIDNIDQLALQNKLPYGLIRGGSTESFFKNPNASLQVKQMWYRMESTYPPVFVENGKKGIERVKKGHFVFLSESNSIEYNVDRDCELRQLDGLFNWRGYGVVLPKNNDGCVPQKYIDKAIQEMEKSGTLAKLKARWWKEKDGGDKCSKKCNRHFQLHPAAISGLFCLISTGVLISIAVAGIEFVCAKNETLSGDVCFLNDVVSPSKNQASSVHIKTATADS